MCRNGRYVAIMDAVAQFIRSQRTRLARLWEQEVRRELPTPRPVLLDDVPAFLAALADWIEGKTERAERGFVHLLESEALQQLGYGVGLETLTREYSRLRTVLARELLTEFPGDAHLESIVRLQQGVDRAIGDAIQRYAARREEVRERFIGILGHDLRDPLSTVVISANLLATDRRLQRDERQVAALIVRACDRMQRMINDVLDFARGHLGGGIPATPTPNDMGKICRAAIDEISAAHPGCTIDLDVSGDVHGELDRDR